MGAVDDLSAGNMRDIDRRLRALETATPLNHASIGAGGVRVHSGGVITIQNGGLSVTGTATISGVLNADGTVTLSGTFTQSGPSTFTGDTSLNGPTHINGATDIAGNTTVTGTMTVNGPLNINGASTLTGDLSVTGGGIIDVGPNMTLNPAVSGGSVQFFAGGGVENAGGVTAIKGAGNAGLISNTTASLFAATNSVDVSPSVVSITGPVELNSLTSTASAANVYFDPTSKRLYYKP